MTTTIIDPFPAGEWLMRVTSPTELIGDEEATFHVPWLGGSDERAEFLAAIVEAYLRGRLRLTLGAAVFDNHTGLVIINEGEHRFDTLELAVWPREAEEGNR